MEVQIRSDGKEKHEGCRPDRQDTDIELIHVLIMCALKKNIRASEKQMLPVLCVENAPRSRSVCVYEILTMSVSSNPLRKSGIS